MVVEWLSVSCHSDEEEGESTEGETPSSDSLVEFKQVKMYAQNQIILSRVLKEEREQVELLRTLRRECG